MVGAIVLSPTDSASQEAMVGSAQYVVAARARDPRDAAVQYCLEYLLGSEHPDFEFEGSARLVVQFESILPEAAPRVAYAPIDLDGHVSIVVEKRLVVKADASRSIHLPDVILVAALYYHGYMNCLNPILTSRYNSIERFLQP